ncbi:MAG: phosphoribosylamine--glycine ligase [candidate division NC10 bacterium]|nr:phosphoribosylamine--glycine ligase [candidate division NC10 bacterium]
MKILVVGSGGREHALVWKLAQSPLVSGVYAAPGNAGMAAQARLANIPVTDISGLSSFAQREGIDLTVVGPELPLTLGIVDEFVARGLPIFGANQRAALIEGSKIFAKRLMKKYGIPTASFQAFTSSAAALQHLKKVGAPIVVKADGLAAGKGVIVCQTEEEAAAAIRSLMEERVHGEAGNRVILEECLTGEEVSYLVLTDGQAILPLASSQDHKRVFDGDQGPNTGGMGAYSPAPIVTPQLEQRILEEIVRPTIAAMAQEGRPYQGVLYAGLMIQEGQPKVLEFNARFGDPETQPLLVRMKSDLAPLLLATLEGNLEKKEVAWREEAAVCVVMASGGYPDFYAKGKPISGLEQVAEMEEVVAFHAGTAFDGSRIVTSGGRVLGITALGKGIKEAIDRAYEAVSKIYWEGAHYRKDIGHRALHISHSPLAPPD